MVESVYSFGGSFFVFFFALGLLDRRKVHFSYHFCIAAEIRRRYSTVSDSFLFESDVEGCPHVE